MKAVHFGAGNIGRGLIGQILHQNGFNLCFIDTNPELIHQLNQDKCYTIEIIDEMNRSDFIDHVVALNSLSEPEEVITATKNADILTTSVGAINLVKIAPFIAQALSKRFEQKHSINIVANENVINASDMLKKEIYSLLSEEEQENFDEYAYFVNTAIDRQSLGKTLGGKMISVVEPYHEWIMNRQQLDPTTSFDMKNVNLVDDMEPYIERKLYIVNAAHAAVAYLGALKGYKTIQEAIQNMEIFNLVKQFLMENIEYFVQKYYFSREELTSFVEKTLNRHGNQKLSDEITRVGSSPIRKLGPDDRLIAPIVKLDSFDLPYDAGIKVIAAGYHYRNLADPEAEQLRRMIVNDGLKATIKKISRLEGKLLNEVVAAYGSQI